MNIKTLADFKIKIFPRCSGCGVELPRSAPAEKYGNWIVAACTDCKRMTPLPLEAA